MSVPHECASIIYMAYSISQRIDCEFLMTVPYTGVDLRLPENRWRVQQMVDALESGGGRRGKKWPKRCGSCCRRCVCVQEHEERGLWRQGTGW